MNDNSTSNRANDDKSGVGNYAVATIKTRPWLSSQGSTSLNVVGSGKNRRSKNQPQIVNPIFEACAQKITDSFWVSVFSQAAIGKFPRGFMFKDNALTYKRGTKIQRIELSTDPSIAVIESMSFFTRTAGIMSSTDQERSRRELEDRLLESQSLHSCSWTEIKKKKVREMLIGTFIEDLVHKYGLSDREKINLKSMINLGFILGYFQNNNVHFEHGRIQSIAGLNYDEVTRKFSIDSSCVPRISKSSKNKFSKTEEDSDGLIKDPHIVSFMTLWIRFLESLEKRIHSKGHTTSLESPVSEPNWNQSGAASTTNVTTDIGSSTATSPTSYIQSNE